MTDLHIPPAETAKDRFVAAVALARAIDVAAVHVGLIAESDFDGRQRLRLKAYDLLVSSGRQQAVDLLCGDLQDEQSAYAARTAQPEEHEGTGFFAPASGRKDH